MSLDKAILEKALLDAWEDDSEKEVDPIEARKRQAKKIADAIDFYVRSGDVNVSVTTVGSATSQTGTGKGKVT